MKVFFLLLIYILKPSESFVLKEEEESDEYQDDNDGLFPLSLIHLNDFHARFEPMAEELGVTCKPESGQKCVGGYGRVIAAVKTLKKERINPIYLNAGDNFQGTLWYNIHRWNVTSHFLNLLPADVMTLGNHEFDHGIDGVIPFMDSIKSPIVLSNVDNSNEPEFKNFQKSIVLERGGRKIGIVGVILKRVSNIANTGNLTFLDEIESVKMEAEKLRMQGINIIIVLSHCGYDVDMEIAKKGGADIDIIVGGHTHTFLYSGEHSRIPGMSLGEYPTVVAQEGGHKVLIIQAGAYTKLLGDITLFIDEDGFIQEWEGNPVYLDEMIEPDEEIEKELISWRVTVDEKANNIVGIAIDDLDKESCLFGECKLGNIIANSFVEKLKKDGKDVPIAIHNSGGIRTGLAKGNVTYGDLVSVVPFENHLHVVELRGDYLLAILEYGASKVVKLPDGNFSLHHMIQVSGLRIDYNLTNPLNERVVAVLALRSTEGVPTYEPLNPFKLYKVIACSWLVEGKGGFAVFKERGHNLLAGPLDIDAISEYFERRKEVKQNLDGRIRIFA